MISQKKFVLLFFLTCLLTTPLGLLGLTNAVSQDQSPQAESETAIRQAVEAYVAAFNSGDAKALAALWAPEAVYINPVSGEEVVGREAIEKQFTDIFAEEKNAKLAATTISIGFVSPNVAIEQGTAKVIRPEQDPEVTQYSAVYVKQNGAWLLDRITEEVAIETISHYEQLKELEWMIGRWVDQDEEATVITECNWTRNQNFLTRSFVVQVGDEIDMAGLQIIGWDPADKLIRSWVFDSDGGFGQGVWKKEGNSWHVHQNGVLPDGQKSSAVNIVTMIDDNSCTLQSVNRTLGSELLPNIPEVQINKQ